MTEVKSMRSADADDSGRNEVIEFQETIDVASVAANTVAEQTFTVTGVRVGDYLLAVIPNAAIGVAMSSYRVTAADEVKIEFANPTASPVDPASGAWSFIVQRG